MGIIREDGDVLYSQLISFHPGFLGCNINPQHNHDRAVWASVAVFALAPMQALLNLGTEARMNYPSKLGGNWEWRMTENALSGELQGKIGELNYLYQR